jgi:PAS domain S-box-containing protein
MSTVNTLSPDHPERLAALRRYSVFRLESQASHQRAVNLAAKAVQAPVGLISLVGETSLRIMALIGHQVLTTTRRLPSRLELVLNNRLIQSTDPAIMQAVTDLVGTNTANGPDGPAVFSFFASTPLRTTDNQVIGSLCVLDRVPRALSPHQASLLEDIANNLVAELDVRLELWSLTQRLEAQRLAPADRILESLNQALIAENPDGTLLHWNAAAERLFGYSSAEMLGQPAVGLIPSEEHGLWQERVQQILNGRCLEPFRAVRLHKDGRNLSVQIGLSPIRGAGGRIVGISSLIASDSVPTSAVAPVDGAAPERVRPVMPELGLQGKLESVGGAGPLTQMLGLTGHSGMLRLGSAVIFLRAGRVIHAEHPYLKDQEAVIVALGLDRGDFQYIPGLAPTEATLNLDVNTLALEAARRSDEAIIHAQDGFTGSTVGVITLPDVPVALRFMEGIGGPAEFQAQLEQVSTHGAPHLVLTGRGIKIVVLVGSLHELPPSIRRR